MNEQRLDDNRLQQAMRAVDEAVQRPKLPQRPTIAALAAEAEGYEPLAAILSEAYQQCAQGKGRARHARNVPFDRQPIMELQRMVGPGFAAGQAMKKVQESMGMIMRGDKQAAVDELLGAIVYAAATIAMIRELP